MFTRKHFNAVASILDANVANESLVNDFADMFADDNRLFDRDKFTEAATRNRRSYNIGSPR